MDVSNMNLGTHSKNDFLQDEKMLDLYVNENTKKNLKDDDPVKTRIKKSKFVEPKSLKVMNRIKRNSYYLSSKKIDVPDSNPDDTEPANEWIDANQSTGLKIPSEFKPKPKQKLRIYHLKCKKRNGKINGKRYVLKNVIHDSKHKLLQRNRVNRKSHEKRHFPRSFLVRAIKKEDKYNQESLKGNSNTEDEFNEDDEEEEEEEYDEDEKNEETNEEKNDVTEKSDCKKSLKDTLKTDRTVIERTVKMDEGTSPLFKNSQMNLNFVKSKTNLHNSDDVSDISKTVLIDADIKLDSTLSSALKNILGKRKEKYA